MVAPAAGFYATPGLGQNEVRIAYVLKERDLEAAVTVLGEALPAYAPRARPGGAAGRGGGRRGRARLPRPRRELGDRGAQRVKSS